MDIRSLHKQTGMFTYDPGFVATASCRSSITYIDGDKGILRYRGYPIEQLAAQCSFLEVSFLLLYGELPNKTELGIFRDCIKKHLMINESLTKFFQGFRYDSHPMAMLVGVDVDKIRIGVVAHAAAFKGTSQVPERGGF